MWNMASSSKHFTGMKVSTAGKLSIKQEVKLSLEQGDGGSIVACEA